MAEGALAVEALGLTRRFGERAAVDGIDLAVRPGECFGILGPNGAGKTSTLRMIYARLPPSGGILRVLGLDVATAARAVKARLGVVPQHNNLDTELTARENLLVYAWYFGIPGPVARRRAEELLAYMELSDRRDTRVERLSGGMQRRLIIARGLINDPELLVLDEPTTGLDPQARLLVWERLAALKQRGVTLLLTTHYMEEASRLCDRLVIMDEGRVLARGSPAQLVATAPGATSLEDVFFGLAGRRLREESA